MLMKLLLDLSFCFCIFAISPHRKEEKEPRNKTHKKEWKWYMSVSLLDYLKKKAIFSGSKRYRKLRKKKRKKKSLEIR